MRVINNQLVQITNKNKLFRWIFIGLFFSIIEYDVIIGGATVQQYLGWSATTSALLFYISSAIVLLISGFSLLLIPVLSDMLKAPKLSMKQIAYSLTCACIVFITVFTSNAVYASSVLSVQAIQPINDMVASSTPMQEDFYAEDLYQSSMNLQLHKKTITI